MTKTRRISRKCQHACRPARAKAPRLRGIGRSRLPKRSPCHGMPADRAPMTWRHTIVRKTAMIIAALLATMAGAAAAEEGKYPDLRGQWTGVLRSRPGIPG